jgi:hypothetical protein
MVVQHFELCSSVHVCPEKTALWRGGLSFLRVDDGRLELLEITRSLAVPLGLRLFEARATFGCLGIRDRINAVGSIQVTGLVAFVGTPEGGLVLDTRPKHIEGQSLSAGARLVFFILAPDRSLGPFSERGESTASPDHLFARYPLGPTIEALSSDQIDTVARLLPL